MFVHSKIICNFANRMVRGATKTFPLFCITYNGVEYVRQKFDNRESRRVFER